MKDINSPNYESRSVRKIYMILFHIVVSYNNNIKIILLITI